jgi:hypothetical protein
MEDQSSANSPNSGLPKYLLLFHQLLLSITVAFAAALALLLSLYHRVVGEIYWRDPSNYLWLWYVFLRAAVRLNSVFGREPTVFGRKSDSLLGVTIAFLTITFAFGFVILVGLYAVGKTRLARLILDPIAGTFLFSLFPLLPFGLQLLSNPGSYEPGGQSRLTDILPMASLALAIVAGVIYLTREWVFPLWVVFLTALYYALFAWLFFGRNSWMIWGSGAQFDSLKVVFFFVTAAAGTLWIFFARSIRQRRMETSTYAMKRVLSVNVPVLVLCLIPWLPGISHSVAHPKDMSSVIISLKRSGCYGTCPVYEITIHGDGSARYEGKMFVRSKGPEMVKISRETLTDLLQSFDREDFSTIDDRAFGICFDAPHTIITISVDGYTKTADIDDCLAKSKPKSSVLEIGREIDNDVDSEQWVECHGSGCVWR